MFFFWKSPIIVLRLHSKRKLKCVINISWLILDFIHQTIYYYFLFSYQRILLSLFCRKREKINRIFIRENWIKQIPGCELHLVHCKYQNNSDFVIFKFLSISVCLCLCFSFPFSIENNARTPCGVKIGVKSFNFVFSLSLVLFGFG